MDGNATSQPRERKPWRLRALLGSDAFLSSAEVWERASVKLRRRQHEQTRGCTGVPNAGLTWSQQLGERQLRGGHGLDSRRGRGRDSTEPEDWHHHL